MVGVGLAIIWAARTFGARQLAACVAAPIALLAIAPWISDRPQMASYLMAPLVLGLARRADPDGRLRVIWLVALAGSMVVWVNLHSAALAGVAVVGALELGAAVDRVTSTPSGDARPAGPGVAGARRQPLRALVAPAVVVVTTALATLVNPWGLDLYRHAADVRHLSSTTIDEWYPLVRAGALAVIPLLAMAVALAVVVTAGPRRRWTLVAPLVALAGLTVDSVRNAPFLVLAVAVLATPMLPTRLPPWARTRSDPANLATVAVLAMLAVGVVVAVPRIAGER